MSTASETAFFDAMDPDRDAKAPVQLGTHVPAIGPADRSLRVEVVFATLGRGSVLSRVVEALVHQTLQPHAVTISCVSVADAGEIVARGDLKLLLGPAGLSRQRNLALRHLAPDTDIVVFFDDDFVAHPTWIEEVERCFRHGPGISAVTGHVIADGIKGPGLAFAEACTLLKAPGLRRDGGIRENYSPYGCNMAFRRSAIHGLWFDERLVLYGWLEDRDYGGALAQRGDRLIKLGAAVGVHMGVKAGRLSGRRLGYSQVVNPAYLHAKGTMTLASLLHHWFKNVASNLVLSLRPEPHIDRRGRLAGNVIGVSELLRGVARPERAETL